MSHLTSLNIFHSIHNTILCWRIFNFFHISRKPSHVLPHITQYFPLHPQYHTFLKTLPFPPHLQKTLTCPTTHHSIYPIPTTNQYSSEDSSFFSTFPKNPHMSHLTSFNIFQFIQNPILFWRLFLLNNFRKPSHVSQHITSYIPLHPHTLLKNLPSLPIHTLVHRFFPVLCLSHNVPQSQSMQ